MLMCRVCAMLLMRRGSCGHLPCILSGFFSPFLPGNLLVALLCYASPEMRLYFRQGKGDSLMHHPSPLQCPWLWWSANVPFDAVSLLHIRVWEAACLHSIFGPFYPLSPQTRVKDIPVWLTHPVPIWLLRVGVCFFLM